jgi:hypothetical protein
MKVKHPCVAIAPVIVLIVFLAADCALLRNLIVSVPLLKWSSLR